MSEHEYTTVGEGRLRSRASRNDGSTTEPEESIQAKVMRMNMEGAGDGKQRKMFGRTPDGKSESSFRLRMKHLETVSKMDQLQQFDK